MNDDVLHDLLEAWEEGREKGLDLSAEELCQKHPQYRDRLQEQIAVLKKCEWMDSRDELVPAGYKKVARIGRGGFGEVWRALAPGGFPCALKYIHLSDNTRSELRALEYLKELRHPNILSVFGTFQQEDTLIVAMELAEKSLMNRFKEAKGQGLPGIPVDELLMYLTDAACGIDYLNEPRHPWDSKKGIQHRDIKPENLLLVGGRVKVADFGIAREIGGVSSAHTGVQTLAYGAPEFFEGRVTNQSDQYCLAVSYYHVRTGSLPFKGSPLEIMDGHRSRRPNLAALPDPERTIVAKAMCKFPQERWPSCIAFVNALKQAVSGNPGITVPVVPEKMPMRLMPWIVAAAAVLVFMIVVAILFVNRLPGDRQGNTNDTPVVQVQLTEAAVFRGHEKGILDLALSANDKTLVSCDEGHDIRIWDVSTGNQTQHITVDLAPGQALRSAILLHDGESVLAGHMDGSLSIWSRATGAKIGSVPSPRTPQVHRILSTSTLGGAFVSWENGPVGFLNTTTRKVEWIGRQEYHGNEIALAADANILATGGKNGDVSLWDGERLSPLGTMREFDAEIWPIAISADGKVVASCERGRKWIRIWNVKDKKIVGGYDGHAEPVMSIALSRNGELAFSTGGNDIHVWETKSGKIEQKIAAHRARIERLVLSDDNRRLFSAGLDREIKMWRIALGDR